MTDIVLPSKNEKELITTAEKLNLTEIIFLYPNKLEKIEHKHPKIKIKTAISKPGPQNFRIIKCDDKIRNTIERKLADMIYGFELSERNDFIHFRNSGMNQVICKLMADKNISYGINFNSILKNNGTKRAIILGRIKQNIKLCKKYKIKYDIYSFATKPTEMRNKKDMKALLNILEKE